jgi:16S rRNA (cytosine967-C5)-methyltransferase
VPAPARTAALRALQAVDAGRADLPDALARARARLADPRDRALTGDIVIGTLRWQRLLDYLIAHAARRPLEKLDAEVRLVLRLSLYQLLHLDRVPAAAVVDDAVDLVRLARRGHASGFVNAVLRTLLRTRNRLPIPSRPADPADRAAGLAYLGVTCSHPAWLVERWLDRYGFDAADAWVRVDNETPAPCVRANRLRIERPALQAAFAARGLDAAPAQWAPDGLTITDGRLDDAGDGTWLVQDEASQLVALTVGARPGDRVLDVCAAPGGKTTALAVDMADTGLLVATDVRPRRVALLRETVASPRRHSLSAPRSTACWSTRPARASARCAATPTSGGGAPPATSPGLPRRSARCSNAQRS